VYVGVLTLPYYLSKSEPDTGFWPCGNRGVVRAHVLLRTADAHDLCA
jgi:hypothetical protein